MPKFDKPDSPNIIWGVDALAEDLTRPDDSYIQTGWTQVKPPYEYENYSMNKLYQGFAYYNQLGFPEWDSVTEYQAGKSYVQAANNRVYKCVQTHSNKNPATAGNESWWELFEGNRQATTTSRGTVRLATDLEVSSGTDIDSVLKSSDIFSLISSGLLSGTGEIKIPISESGVRKTLHVQWGRYTSSASGKITANFKSTFANEHFGSVGSFFGGFVTTTGASVKIEKNNTSTFNFAVVDQSGNFSTSPVFIVHFGY